MSYIEVQLKKRDKNLYKKLQSIKNRSIVLLKSIRQIFPEYTPHDIKHKNEVVSNIELVFTKEMILSFNKYELFFLLAACYVHDIGMAPLGSFDVPQRLSKDAKKEHIRKNHHLRTEKYIVENYKRFSLISQEANIIGRIARGHRNEDLHDLELFNPDRTFNDQRINIPLLASILRLADELDITYKRTPFLLYKKYPPKDEISDLEWKRHMSIEGLAMKKRIIISSAICSHHKIPPKLFSLRQKINYQIEELPNHLHNYVEFENDLPTHFDLKVEGKDGLIPIELSFSLDQNAILNLLMGRNIYIDETYAIREILKNSVDTCRRKREKLNQSMGVYNPLITITKMGNTLTISDNGMGMNERFLKTFFSRVGRSFYRSSEFINEGLDFSPVGELGIGILSSFMIASRLVIETKTDLDPPIRVEIEDISEPFSISKGNIQSPGTSVSLRLKKDISNDKLYSLVQKFLRHVELDIEFRSSSLNKKIQNIKFEPSTALVSSELRVRNKQIRGEKEIQFYVINVKNEMIEGYIALIGKSNENGDFEPISHKPLFKNNKFFISNNGVLIQDTLDYPNPIVPFWLDQHSIIGDLNLKKHNLKFSVSRDKILFNEGSEKMLSSLSKLISIKIGNLIVTNPKTFDISTKNFFIENYIFSTHEEKMGSKKNWTESDLLNYQRVFHHIDLCRKFYMVNCIWNEKIVDKTIDALKNSNVNKKLILGHYYSMQLTDDYLTKLAEKLNQDKRTLCVISYSDALSDILKSLLRLEPIWAADLLTYRRLNILDDLILSSGWRLVKINNHKTTKFIELAYDQNYHNENSFIVEDHEYFALNKSNVFVKMLITQQNNIIRKNRKSSVMNFLFQIQQFLHSPQKIIDSQRTLLREFISSDIIKANELKRYSLTALDFPWE